MLFHRYFKQAAALFPNIQILLFNVRPSRHFLLTPVRLISTDEIFSCNVQIGKLVRLGKIEAARQLFDKMPERDVVSWNAIVAAYWKNGDIEESKRMFSLMPTRDAVSWNSMIAGCIEHERMEEACAYFHAMPDRNVASWNAMISGFARNNRVEEAARLFEEMPKRNVISYTAMLDGYTRNGLIDRARALFDRIPWKNVVSWTVMISGYVESGRFEEARGLFDRMPEKNVVALTAMITGYCKEGKMEDARKLFERIQHKDLVSWNAMIGGYVHNGHGEEALKFHSLMMETGTRPNHSTMVVVVSACSLLASLQQGRQAHAIVEKCGFKLNTSVCNALITMYSKCGSIHESESVFRQTHSPDLVSWNTVIAAYVHHGHYEIALGLFDEMRTNGLKPDGKTFLSVLSACGHVGKVKECMDWFSSMAGEYGVTPRAEHYSCLVDILSRAGQLEKAYDFMRQM